jgi:hypothetical protein
MPRMTTSVSGGSTTSTTTGRTASARTPCASTITTATAGWTRTASSSSRWAGRGTTRSTPTRRACPLETSGSGTSSCMDATTCRCTLGSRPSGRSEHPTRAPAWSSASTA